MVVKSTSAVAVDDGWVIMTSCVFAPTTSVSVPKLVLPVTPEMDEVPLFVILPEAKGVPAVGRTLTFCQVNELVTPLLVAAVIVMVSWAVVTVTAIVEPLLRSLMLRVLGPLPPMRVTKTVGAAPPVSNSKPDGALRIMVPVPMSAVAPSDITGPVNEVKVPPVVSAEIAEPPVAEVTVAVARTFVRTTNKPSKTIVAKIKSLFAISYIIQQISF